MVRFANNSLTVTKNTKETELYVYLGKDRRRIVAATSNPDESSVRTFIKKLFDSLQRLPKGSDYASLPEKARHYKPSEEGYDRKIEAVGTELSALAGEAIESARKNGGERSAGALVASVTTSSILTSNGTSGRDRGASITLNIRSFSQNDASGHGLSCASKLSGFDPAEAGKRAEENAKKIGDAKRPQAGQEEGLMRPKGGAKLIGLV